MMSEPGPRRCRHAGLRVAAAAVALALTAGCASRSIEVVPKPGDPAAYAGWDCDRLHDEMDAVQRQAAEVAYAVDERAGNNVVALGIGVTVFWPALLAMRPDGPESDQLAELKGRYEALQAAAARRSCRLPSEAMPARRAATLPVALGERLVYESRDGSGRVKHRLGLQVSALRRDQIEYRVDVDGKPLDDAWRQDLAGNVQLEKRPPLVAWRRLLKPDLALGQVLSGELAAPDETQPSGRLRGQVVATGAQTIAGRRFDVAVVELFGEVPSSRGGLDDPNQASARLDGVIAVDRASGVLLRLELRSSNGDFALRWRLVQIDPAAKAASAAN